MKYDLNKLIKYEGVSKSDRNKTLRRGDLNKDLICRELATSDYDYAISDAKLTLQAIEAQMESKAHAPSFSLNKKKIVFENIQKTNEPLYLGYCYLTGYGTKKDVDMATNCLKPLIEGKKLLASAYILGRDVPRDFNKAYKVYPEFDNPVGDFSVYINGEVVSVRKLLFGKDKE